MTSEEIGGKVKEILLEILDVKEEDIVPTATLGDDLSVTSIDLVEILTAFANTFDLQIREVDAARVKTVQDIIDYLKIALDQKSTTS
jgi:acyl carrier protein